MTQSTVHGRWGLIIGVIGRVHIPTRFKVAFVKHLMSCNMSHILGYNS